MRPARFEAKLRAAQQARGTEKALLLTPRLLQMPLPIQKYDDPFLPFGKAIIGATRDLVCGYVFDLASYLTIGAAGAVALERTIAYAGVDDHTITVLHGPFVGAGYVDAAGSTAFNVDAVTLDDALDADAYQDAGLGVFVVGSKPGGVLTALGGDLRLLLAGEQVLYAGRAEDFAEQVRAALLR